MARAACSAPTALGRAVRPLALATRSKLPLATGQARTYHSTRWRQRHSTHASTGRLYGDASRKAFEGRGWWTCLKGEGRAA